MPAFGWRSVVTKRFSGSGFSPNRYLRVWIRCCFSNALSGCSLVSKSSYIICYVYIILAPPIWEESLCVCAMMMWLPAIPCKCVFAVIVFILDRNVYSSDLLSKCFERSIVKYTFTNIRTFLCVVYTWWWTAILCMCSLYVCVCVDVWAAVRSHQLALGCLANKVWCNFAYQIYIYECCCKETYKVELVGNFADVCAFI